MDNSHLKILILSFLAVFIAAFIGSLFSSSSANTSWYSSINPSIAPPNFVFPVAWTVLFILIALSLYFSWTAKAGNKKQDKKNKINLFVIFGVNLILNILWSFFFFLLKNPMISFYELILLWVSILFMIFAAYRIRRLSSYLLVPYALWVAFAGILNYIIVFG